MPPKRAGKKKGKGKAKKEKKNQLPEVDKTFYELQIAEINRRLARLRGENEVLRNKTDELSANVKSMEEDRCDVIDHLKRVAEQRTEEAETVRLELKQLQFEKEEDEKIFKKSMDDAKEEYRLMHQQLTNEIKLLCGKLNSLDEFRTLRDELMRKFQAQERMVEENSKAHARQVYELERKLVEGKYKLKKMMEQKLFHLSNEFHDAAEICISDTTHRVIRENIALNNELDQMMSTQVKLQQAWDDASKRDKQLILQSKIDGEDISFLHKSNRLQSQLLKRLSEQTEVLLEKMDSNARHEVQASRDRVKLKLAQDQLMALNQRHRIAEQNLHALRCAVAQYAQQVKREKKATDFMVDVLRVATLMVRAIMKLYEIKSMNKDERSKKQHQLCMDLYKLLKRYKEQDKLKIATSDDTVKSLEEIYRMGDLGFTPTSSKKSIQEEITDIVVFHRDDVFSAIGLSEHGTVSGETAIEELTDYQAEAENISEWSLDFAAPIEDSFASSIRDELESIYGSDIEKTFIGSEQASEESRETEEDEIED